jgi:hypothetical protein
MLTTQSRLEGRLIEDAYRRLTRFEGKSHHVTYVCRRNRILCYGVNKEFRTHPLASRYGYYGSKIHSELSAIVKFPKPPSYLSRCSLWNIRLNKAGEVVLARPCKRCIKLLDAFGVGEVFYTSQSGDFEALY